MRCVRWFLGLIVLFAVLTARADGPNDNNPDNVKRIPQLGIELPPAERAELAASVEALGKEIEQLRTSLKGKPALLDLLPDVQIYHNAVRYALTYREFLDKSDVTKARKLLEQGRDRAAQLR